MKVVTHSGIEFTVKPNTKIVFTETQVAFQTAEEIVMLSFRNIKEILP